MINRFIKGKKTFEKIELKEKENMIFVLRGKLKRVNFEWNWVSITSN